MSDWLSRSRSRSRSRLRSGPPAGRRIRVAWALLTLALLVAAGCGGGQDDAAEGGHDDAEGSGGTQAAGGHSHHEPVEVPDGTPAPTVDLTVTPDPVEGFNLQLETTNFTWAPENASAENVMGEGHAHLYVDGEKVARVYGTWHHLGDLDPGRHEIRADLNANDHAPYAAGGNMVGDVVTVEVPGEADADQVIEVDAVDGQPDGGARREPVELGRTIMLRVTSDVADDVHVHGYDRMVGVGPDDPAELVFTADVAGVFEVELEEREATLLELEVR